MSWLAKIIGGEGISKPVDSVANLIDRTFTSDEERLKYADAIEKLKAASLETQAQQNNELAKSDSRIAKAARPFLMLVSGLNFAQVSVAIVWLGRNVPEWWAEATVTSFLGALGIYGALRSFEKAIGKAK